VGKDEHLRLPRHQRDALISLDAVAACPGWSDNGPGRPLEGSVRGRGVSWRGGRWPASRSAAYSLPPSQVAYRTCTRNGRQVASGRQPRAINDALRLEDATFVESKATRPAVKRVSSHLNRIRGVQSEDVAISVEALPGEVAQVDFG